MNSNFLNLNTKDFIKSLIVAIIAVILVGLEQIIQAGSLPNVAQLKVIGLSAVIAGISYIVKNLLTNSQDQFFKPDPKVTTPAETPK